MCNKYYICKYKIILSFMDDEKNIHENIEKEK